VTKSRKDQDRKKNRKIKKSEKAIKSFFLKKNDGDFSMGV